MTKGNITLQLLLFFFPILLGTFFQQLYNTADAVIVGQNVGKLGLAAVGGTTSTIINLFIGVFVGLSSGFSVIVSQHYGAKNDKLVSICVHTSIAFSLIVGIIVSILGIIFSKTMLSNMNIPDDMMSMALPYLQIYFIAYATYYTIYYMYNKHYFCISMIFTKLSDNFYIYIYIYIAL